MTRLCVPIFVQSLEQAKTDVGAAIEAGADVIELRIDALESPEIPRLIVSQFDIPFILTCRPEWEGGHSVLPPAARVALLAAIAPSNDRVMLDVELRTTQQTSIQEVKNPVIISSHDFTGRPATLTTLFHDLTYGPPDVVKLVWTARSVRDNVEAFELLQAKLKPTIMLCMGEAGLISRVLAKKFGAYLTFASLRDESATAPGQVTIADMKHLYRWDAINASTKVYGVVGSPVMHSLSPAIHNGAFDTIGYDGVYLPMLVQPGYESFKAFMESFLAFAPLDLGGLSITIPHKENALRYLKEKGAEVEDLALRIGTVNTIAIERAEAEPGGPAPLPVLHGLNTDYGAILDTITSALSITRSDLARYRVAVLGAGGTGRTAVAALAHCGATVVVYNRTKERADSLAKEFNGKRGKVVAARMEKLCDSCCQIYVNTTSVGMHPNVDASPVGDNPPSFTNDTLVFDAIYNPIRTKLLQQASAAGAKTVDGVEMFVRQAAGQFHAWTGAPAPLQAMKKIIHGKLGNA